MKKKIMILENDEATADLIKFYLDEEGFQVAVYSEGVDFVNKAAVYQPDLITLDVLLPDSNGFSIFKELRQDERTMNIPVIFISVLEKEKDKGMEMGAKGYLVKPFKEDELKNTIKTVLEKE